MAEPRRTSWRLLALVAPLVLLAPVAAHAEKVVTEDAAGDAQARGYDLAYYPAPQEATADIVRTVAALGHHRLQITVHVRDLRVRPRHETKVRVGTPEATFDLGARRLSASRPRVALAARGGRAVPCSGLRATYDGAADEVSISVPATCIGSPRWVRLGVGVHASPEANPENPSSFISFSDDGHRDGASDRGLRAGPRIHRG